MAFFGRIGGREYSNSRNADKKEVSTNRVKRFVFYQLALFFLKLLYYILKLLYYSVTSFVGTIAIFSLISWSRCLLVPPPLPLRVRIGLSCLYCLFVRSLSLLFLLRLLRPSLSLPELLLLLLLRCLLLGWNRLQGPVLSRFSYSNGDSHWGRLSSSVKPLFSRPDLAEDPLWSL